MSKCDFLAQKGMTFAGSGECNGSIEAYDIATELNPRLAEAKLWQRPGLCQTGQIQRLLPGIRCGYATGHHLVEGWYSKGLAQANQGRFNESLREFVEAIRFDPALAEAWYSKGLVLPGKLRRYIIRPQ